MSNVRHQNFRTFLTDRFTAAAVEIFGEVEAIMETYYEENKRLRNILHMVLNPEIKLPRIDVNPNTRATTDGRELNSTRDPEIAEPLPKKPKEEPIEQSISDISEQQEQQQQQQQQQQQPQKLDEATNFITPDCVKNDPEEDLKMPYIVNVFHIETAEVDHKSSDIQAADEVSHEQKVSVGSGRVADYAQLSRSEGGAGESQRPQICSTKETKKKRFQQKTMLEWPRMMPCKPLPVVPVDHQSFLQRLTEAYKDFPDDKKPLITKMGLTTNVPKGSPLSHPCPVPSSQEYVPNDDAPPRPQLPLPHHHVEPFFNFPKLGTPELEHLQIIKTSWKKAHSLELSTRECSELVEELRKRRLTNHFSEVCRLKSGQSNVEHLLFKIQKGPPKSKSPQIAKEMKAEVLRVYCRNLCVNWYPCGFVVHPCAPWLGTLPDGLVYDPTEKPRFGLVHVKYTKLQSFVKCRFLICQDGVLKLKKHHPYYWHIQVEMIISGTSWCDLLVFSRQDMLVQRIYRDKFANTRATKKKLDEFYFFHYLPRLLQTNGALTAM